MMFFMLALAAVISVILHRTAAALSNPLWESNHFHPKEDPFGIVADRRSFLSVTSSVPTWVQADGAANRYKQRKRSVVIDSNDSNEKKGSILILHESNRNPDRLLKDIFRTMSGKQFSNTTPVILDLDVRAIPCDSATPSKFSAFVNTMLQQSQGGNLAVVGMGFGGTLAMYTALQCLLPSSTPPSVPPVAAISINGLLDLKWGMEQGQTLANGRRLEDLDWLHESSASHGTVDWDFANRSPIDMLPPVSKNLRQQAVSVAKRSVTPPNCYLGLVHAEKYPAIVPIEHSTRFTVAACVAGIEVDYHRIKQQRKPETNHHRAEDCFNPDSTSWKITKSMISKELARGRRTPQQFDHDKMLSQPPLMKPTIRIENDKEILIQTRHAVPLYV